ncbi:hypothetical protein [Brachyspira alvinipulli]|uniref:hypothetical protein n=1 Tax=Brachyspira alvinipulli TaxID=84379 RepID=UPI0004B1E4BE|nr:hypothetical protein [Brachyspira alvinipulli]
MPMGQSDKNNSFGLEGGFDVLIGYRAIFSEAVGMSFYADLGYSYDTFRMAGAPQGTDIRQIDGLNLHSLKVGFLPKVNIYDKYSIGLGLGVKLPLGGSRYSRRLDGTTGALISTTETTRMFLRDLQNNYSSLSVIPYIKLTFDYTMFNTAKSSADLGLYLGYDIGLRQGSSGIDSIDFGLQFSLRFRPYGEDY